MIGLLQTATRLLSSRRTSVWSSLSLTGMPNSFNTPTSVLYSRSRRVKSSLAVTAAAEPSHHDDSDDEDDGEGGADGETFQRPSSSDHDDINDLTFNRRKSGTPSPWVLFDEWGPRPQREDNHIHNEMQSDSKFLKQLTDKLSPSDQQKLTAEAVRIPFGEKDSHQQQIADTTEILQAYDMYLQQRSEVHFGYPYNLQYNHEELYGFMKYSINNLGDPFITSNYGVHSRQFECAVIDFFARLWNIDDYWGYVTTSGTEGNLHGILLARECHPTGILYTSNESHYSIFKAARYYRMDVRAIPTLPMGEINYDLLARELDQNRDYPAIINVNIGTTVKGAVDNLDRILDILTTLDIPRDRYHIHCDGALFALMMPFLDNAPEISFQKPIDSIAVSGHKMLGCPMPCGVTLSRKEHVKKVEQHIDYLNSVDTTIMGSRNGQAALFMWYSLRKKGVDGIKRDVMHCIETAHYLRAKLSQAGIYCRLNTLSSTVVLERPVEDSFIKRWQLACEDDIAHVVVMPNVTPEKIDLFVHELVESVEKHGRIKAAHQNSPLNKLKNYSWDSIQYNTAQGNKE